MHYTEFAARRRALGISQDELAKRLGVATTTVARWERGERPIRSNMMRFSFEAIEDDLREEWEKLPAEEKYRRNQEKMASALRKADEREAAMTPEQQEAAERWFPPY